MGEPVPVTEGRKRAQLLRYDLDLGGAPIRDLFGFVERSFTDIFIARRPINSGPQGALIRHGNRWVILVNTADSLLVRQRFTAAHELGHYLFDRDRGPLLVDQDVYAAAGDPVEVRANAFAVHLLLPADVLRSRVADVSFSLQSDEDIVGLAMNFGISITSLAWHLRNVCGISEAERRRIAQIKVFKVSTRMGLTDRLTAEIKARNTTGWPRRYVSLVAKAYDRGQIDQSQLKELIGPDPALAELLLGEDDLSSAQW